MLKNLFKFEFSNYWRNIDKNIFFGFLLLFFLGIFFSFSSTSSLAGERLNKAYYFFFSKHLIFTVLALSIMFIISALETSVLRKIVVPFFIFSFLLLILVPILIYLLRRRFIPEMPLVLALCIIVLSISIFGTVLYLSLVYEKPRLSYKGVCGQKPSQPSKS